VVRASPYPISIGDFDGYLREDAAAAARLVAQMVEWSYGYFDDRSGSEKLTE